MTNIVAGSNSITFHRKEEIAAYLLKNILANENRKIGSEWEMFLVDMNGKPITRADGQKAFNEFRHVFALKGYDSSYVYEEDANGLKTIFGLNVHGLGLITPEMGHQIEFACSVCDSPDEIREKNGEFYSAVSEVGVRTGYMPIFKGHIPRYVDYTEGSYRSRSIEWRTYFNKRFGAAGASSVREALDATSSIQITIDSGAEKFHEFFKALLLIEPALTIHYANSQRPYVGVNRLPSSHMKPIIDVWTTKNTKEAVEAIVDRLMEVDVPFLPDPEHSEIYKAEPLTNGNPPTVEDLMKQGRLNQKTLNNAGGFLLSRPALRRFAEGLLEMRGVDSQPTPEAVGEIAQHVSTLVYDDAIRENLLSDYARLTSADVLALHRASAMASKGEALNTIVAGMTVKGFVKDILTRSEAKPAIIYAPFSGKLYQRSRFDIQYSRKFTDNL